MNKWELKRREKLREYITVSFMVTGFIIALTIIEVMQRQPMKTTFPIKVEWVVVLFVIYLLTLFFSRYGDRLLDKAILVDSPNRLTYIANTILLLIIGSLVLSLGGASSNTKILFLLPIMVSAGQIGRTFSMTLTGFVAVFLISLDIYALRGVFPNPELESDVIFISILLLLSWLLGGFTDVEKDVRKELSVLATQDDLTALANHRAFQERLGMEVQKAQETGENVGLLLMDIDHFKFYNDTHGHLQGDDALRQVGDLLRSAIHEPFFAGRYGGDEFAIALPGLSEREALEVAEDLRLMIEEHPFYGAEHQPEGKVTASLGLALYPNQAKTKEDLLRRADQALYNAKYTSKNKVELYFSVLDDLRDVLDESEQTLLTSIRTLISIINAKDRYTFGHSERTVIYSTELAKSLGWSDEAINQLKYGAFLHDIGKIEIDREILNKPGKLSSEEFDIMKQHPVWGADILLPMASLQYLYPMIRHHHENFDGSGYPDGLQGEEIPAASRILRIADSFDAMMTQRVYKAAKTLPAAVEELRKGSGICYDPVLVEKFIDLLLRAKVKPPEKIREIPLRAIPQ